MQKRVSGLGKCGGHLNHREFCEFAKSVRNVFCEFAEFATLSQQLDQSKKHIIGYGTKTVDMDFWIENLHGGEYLNYLFEDIPPEDDSDKQYAANGLCCPIHYFIRK